jgi:hypothetical protein
LAKESLDDIYEVTAEAIIIADIFQTSQHPSKIGKRIKSK